MKNKGLVIALTIVITLLCLYYLSFTFASRNVQQDALSYATDPDGIIDLNKKQRYLDSVWNENVYSFLGTEYTYKEVKDNELSLGLDLQGGMHVTLEVLPADILKSLTNQTTDPTFLSALSKAAARNVKTNNDFVDTFFEIYKGDNPEKSLASLFSNSITKGRISSAMSDREVIALVKEEVDLAVDRSFTILRNRIDEFGTSQPNIQRLPGTSRIQIEIPGAENPQRVRRLLQGIAKLEFYDVVEVNTLSPQLLKINDIILQKESTTLVKQNPSNRESDLSTLLADSATVEADTVTTGRGLDSLQSQRNADLFSKSIPPGSFRFSLTDTAWVNRMFKLPEVKAVLPRNILHSWANKPDTDQNGTEALQLTFLTTDRTNKARLSGDAIIDASYTLDEKGDPSVSMRMNAVGSRTWAKWTAEAASKSPRGRIAIVLDGKVYSAPVVNGEIPNGNSQIQGNFTPEEAKDLANILEAGSLPVPTTIVEEAVVGPTLGKVAQNQGFISMACGLAVVVIFMIGYYGKAGAVANLALFVNVFFILGILSQFEASLTLPGIAGIVLTMGMAVDANVIIFERIREELRTRKGLRESIALGFRRSFWTIFDSNTTTFLTALVLFLLGQGPVKGFAITLMIGIATTFFTAVYISRVVIEAFISKKGDEAELSFQTFISKLMPSKPRIDFVRNRKRAYIFSSVFIGAGLIIIVLQGLNYGVDFTGGRSFVLTFNQPVAATEMKVALAESFNGMGTEVKNFGGNNIVKVTTSYLINKEEAAADEHVRDALINGIRKYNGMEHTPNLDENVKDKFTISSSSKVGATIADDIKSSSIKSALISLALIYLYILIRFRRWQFSLGALVSLAHDALFVLAAFGMAAAFGLAYEVDQVFVAAILTVIGYSINDTVIIYDRIREYLNIGTSHNRKDIFNAALNNTLSRTIITSGTTLLVVIALLLFGGEVLRGFSFALFVGIAIGTYSSVFIAAPLVLDLERDDTKATKEKVKDSIQ